MNDRETAREALFHILITANLKRYPPSPDGYRGPVYQLMADYSELGPVLGALFPDEEPLGTRRAFDAAIGAYLVRHVREGRLGESSRPGNYRPNVMIPSNVGIMTPLYAARLAHLMGQPLKTTASQAAA